MGKERISCRFSLDTILARRPDAANADAVETGVIGGFSMEVKGIIQGAELFEVPTSADQVEIQIIVQGVKPGQPRRLVIPFEMLLRDASIEPEAIQGHGFAAEVVEESPGRWVVHEFALAPGRVLRREV